MGCSQLDPLGAVRAEEGRACRGRRANGDADADAAPLRAMARDICDINYRHNILY